MEDGTGVFIVMVTFVAGGVTLMVAAMHNRRKTRELAFRERMALIERGLVPPPEVDPAAFEAAAGLLHDRPSGERYRTAGVSMIGLGLGLMVLITFTANSPDVGLGVGGAWAILGGAMLLNYFLISSRESERPPRRWGAAPPRAGSPPQPPPPNVAP